MRKSLVAAVLAAFAVLTAFAGASTQGAAPLAPAEADRPAGAEFVPGEVIVRFRDGVTRAEQSRTVRSEGGHIDRSLTLADTKVVELAKGADVEDAAEALEDDPDVLSAEPNYVRHASALPNDPNYADLWALPKIGAPTAWQTTTGNQNLIIAVLDTGVAYDHPDLAPNIWTNNDPPGNGDEDGNGYVDDTHGWDFIQDDNAPLDFYGHGVHVAGTIGAKGNNALGVTGVDWNVSLMPVRAGDAYGSFPVDIAADAILYACANGARVVNGSYGGTFSSSTELAAINSATCANTLFVFAAGNNDSNNDFDPTYPCSYASARIICVGASTNSDGFAGYSNFGVNAVDLVAPGGGGGSQGEILSTFHKYLQIGATDAFEDVDWNTQTRWAPYDPGAPDVPLPVWSQQLGLNSPTSAGTHSIGDTPTGLYAANSVASIRNAAPFDFSGKAGCIAVYQLRVDTEEGTSYAGTDWFRVRVGTSETAIETLADEWSEQNGAFGSWYSDLSAVDGSATAYLRFSVDADSDATVGDGANIDDFQVGCLDPTGEEYMEEIGTSMAAPQVSGVAGLVLSAHPSWSTARVKAAILNTVDRKAAFSGVGSGGRLNAARAVVYTAPNTVFKGGPPAKTKKHFATFRFASDGFKSHFQCKLGKNGAWKACTSGRTYSHLKKGPHTLRIRAIDEAGNIDPSPIVRSWRIT